MRARIIDYLYITPTRQRLTIDVYEDFRSTYEKVKDEEADITVKKRGKRKTLTANNYYWVLLDKLAVATGIPTKDLYFDSLRNVGGNMQTYCSTKKAIDEMCKLWEQQGTTGWGWPYDRFDSKLDGCENVRLYYGASAMDQETFSRLIDHLVQDCKACGVETMSPEEIKSLLEGENERTH